MKVKDLVNICDFQVDVLEFTKIKESWDTGYSCEFIYSSWTELQYGGSVRDLTPENLLNENIRCFHVYLHSCDLVMDIILEKD